MLCLEFLKVLHYMHFGELSSPSVPACVDASQYHDIYYSHVIE